MFLLFSALHAAAEPIHITPTLNSPTLIAADIDEDGEVEQISVGFSPLQEVVITVHEPTGGVIRHSLGAIEDFSGIRAVMKVSLTDPAVTGVPLLNVLVPAAEQCGSWDRSFYISYRSPEAGRDGTLQLAIETINGGDSPVYTTEEVVFFPARRAAQLTSTNGSDTEEIITITQHRLLDGVFAVTETTTQHEAP
jgi:hypothetical protein